MHFFAFKAGKNYTCQKKFTQHRPRQIWSMIMNNIKGIAWPMRTSSSPSVLNVYINIFLTEWYTYQTNNCFCKRIHSKISRFKTLDFHVVVPFMYIFRLTSSMTSLKDSVEFTITIIKISTIKNCPMLPWVKDVIDPIFDSNW